jgi:translation initiation factor IF-2
MSKIRINDLARELEVKSKEILDVLTTVGVTEKKTHSSSLEDHEAELVRRHLRGRFDATPGSAKPSARAIHGEEEIKTKIDLSHISRPGDVLRAITQQKGAVEHPAAHSAVKSPAAMPAVEARTEAAAPLAPTKAKPAKPAGEAPAPPAPRMVTPGSVAATYRPPSVVVIPPKAPVTPPAATTSAASAGTAPPAIAVPPRVTTTAPAAQASSA